MITATSFLRENHVRHNAFKRAKQLEGGKGILNVGSGYERSQFAAQVCSNPIIVRNIDVKDTGEPRFYKVNLEHGVLPFYDKEFGVVLASHVLEHLDNWQANLDEWSRVADHVVVVLPHPLAIGGWLHPDHKQHFSSADRDVIERTWDNVEIMM